MTDINYSLRKAYYAALSGYEYNNAQVPVYYNRIPDSEESELYIVFSGISSTDASTKNSDDTDTNITVTVVTEGLSYNDGKACDAIAGFVLEQLHNKSLQMDNGQMVTASLISDNTQDYTIAGQEQMVERILIFKHIIFQN